MSTAGYTLYYHKTNAEITEIINTCITHFKWKYCDLQMQGHSFDEEGIRHPKLTGIKVNCCLLYIYTMWLRKSYTWLQFKQSQFFFSEMLQITAY
jgi:hypothetical protein